MAGRERGLRHAGFTLIEIIVLIAILGILLSLLIPAFNRARDRARTTHCMNNLRGLSMAMHHLLMEHDQRLYIHSASGSGTDTRPHWAARMTTDVLDGDRSMTVCPGWHPYSPQQLINAGHSGRLNFRVYGMNMIRTRSPLRDSDEYDDYEEAGTVVGAAHRFTSTAVLRPADFFIFADSVMPGGYAPDSSPGRGSQRYQIRDWDVGNLDGVHARHNGHANLTFLDGSARTMSPSDLRNLGFVGHVDGDMNNVVH